MRRFITSLTGKVLGQLAILGLVLPYISLAVAMRAEAQLQVLPSWAVTEFRNLKDPSNTTYGKTVADDISTELAKTGQYDITPADTVTRTITTLGLTSPLEGEVNLLRVGQELRANSVVTGDIVDYKVSDVAGGKQAVVSIRTIVYDVASGLPANGASLSAVSTTRPGNVSDDTLINDALSSAANQAVRTIQSQNLPTATVLNTLTDTALINQGSRSGFANGQQVIVTRGRDQVAVARVTELEPDSATIHIERQYKGVAPGDRVRAVFSVPAIAAGFTAANQPRRPRNTARGSNSGLITTLLVLGLVAVLLSGGRSGNNSGTSDVVSEAMLGFFDNPTPDASGVPAVKVSWAADAFFRGNSTNVAWQIWRNDVQTSPVRVVTGDRRFVVDTVDTRDLTWSDFGGIVGGSDCTNGSLPQASVTGVTGVTPGRPYTYQVELVYAVNQLNLPGTGGTGGTGTGTIGGGTGTIGSTATGTTASTGTIGGNTGTIGGNTGTIGGNTGTIGGTNGTGTTATGTTATGTTATGTTATGTTSGTQTFCYFVTERSSSRGLATPLSRIALISPTNNASVSAPTVFSFQSAVNPAFPITVQYVVQFSTSPLFPKNGTTTVSSFVKNDLGNVSSPVIDTAGGSIPASIRTAATVYWRVGARNVADNPGPVPDPSGQRYVFSPARTFTRPSPPPPPPSY